MRRPFSMVIAGTLTLLIVGGMALGMAALLVVGLKNVWRGLRSPSWPTAEGIVSKVEMTSHTSRDSRSQRSSTTYNADLTFRYTVGRATLITDQVQWGQTLGSGDPAEAVVQALNYPEGRRVTVFYNPGRPEEAVVRPGLTGSAFLLPGAAIAFLLFLGPACAMIWHMFFGPGAAGSTGAPGVPPAFGSFIRLFLVIPVLMGAAMLFAGSQNLARARQSRDWTATRGTWLVDLPADKIPAVDALREHRGFPYVYQYETRSGPRYQCVRWFGQGTASGNNSDAEIELEFPRGRALTVYHHPSDPDLAVLSPGVRKFAWILPGGGLGFMLFGVLGMLAAGRR